ncbi:MAG: CRISPR-associated endoribonuclease Cas6 [Bacillota bacterium]
MKFLELISTILVTSDMHYTNVNNKLTELVNGAMHLDKELAQKHSMKGYKLYSFGNLYPIEKDKQYKAGKVYLFRIRSLEQSFIEKIAMHLPNTKNSSFRVLAIEKKEHRQRYISMLQTLTPAIATVDNKCWIPGDDFMLLQQRIQMNLEKKYKAFYGESPIPSQCFIQHLELLNKKPISIKYKDTSLIGNKLRIFVREDETSQKLAFIALATGILEKNSSAGFGFCSAK